MSERLRRLEDTFQRHPIYFVTAPAHERKSILANSKMHNEFIKFGERGGDRGAWLGDYVLMPDHLHLFVALDQDRISLSGWIKSLKNAVVQDPSC